MNSNFLAVLYIRVGIFFSIISLLFSCKVSSNEEGKLDNENKIMERLSPEETGIHFKNDLVVTEQFNVFKYRNFYNGGGVGIADFNKDGLADIFLVSNMGDNQLLINKGDFKFEDMAKKAGVLGNKLWSTGVSIADVNADGWLDIYLCNAGDVEGTDRRNELFINNGDLTFTERATEFGLDDNGLTTHAVFFDYDRDNDLDCYVLNNSYRPVSTLGYRNLRHVRDELGGHRLYQNQNGHFVDVSEQAGIYGSVIGFGLGVTVGDVNQDGWPDLYVSNDFYERDYLYINDKKGGFIESVENYMEHISMFSMGADMADLNNDGYPEIFTTDMLPESDSRLKTLIAFETFDVYQLRQQNGYYRQFMRNMLHVNNKNGKYLELGQLAGVSATDWSWGALIVDFNNDGFKEIFVANGIERDVIDQDFVEFLGANAQIKQAMEGKKINFTGFVDMMPSSKLSNYLFEKQSDFEYTNRASQYGLDAPSFSSGAAYGDIDNDGDLDLVVNNVNQDVFVYRNRSRQLKLGNFISVELEGDGKNFFGVGTQLKAYTAGQIISLEHLPMRGFQSSVDYKMIVGIGSVQVLDSIEIVWPDSRRQVIASVSANQHLKIKIADASKRIEPEQKKLKPKFQSQKSEIRHVENSYNDFDRDRLQYHMLSSLGPGIAQAHLNDDAYEDVFVGGSVGEPSKIYAQSKNLSFTPIKIEALESDTLADITDASFFDADNDGDFDLYLVTGGTEYAGLSPNYLDKFYRNEGNSKKPRFVKNDMSIPSLYQSGSCVRPFDIDNDGDLDLFVGTRVIAGYYGRPCDQFILQNDGQGQFSDATSNIGPELKSLGMVTDAKWVDYDGDGAVDLVIVGEWMPITFFKNVNGKLVKTRTNLTDGSQGWWNTILPIDVDLDGDTDFAVGNLGLNSKFRPSQTDPVVLYVNDFDKNGSPEPVFAFRKNNQDYPMALRQDLVKQMSSIKKKIIYYRDYAGKTMGDLFDKSILESATKLEFYQPRTSILVNKGKAVFEMKALPIEAQVSPVYAIAPLDWNNDSIPDLVIGGNLFETKPEVGRYDALRTLVLQGAGDGSFVTVSGRDSGFDFDGQVRHIITLKNGKESTILLIRNNDSAILQRQK